MSDPSIPHFVATALAHIPVHTQFNWLPIPTPLDTAEEPPGSLDPLGTLAYAERLSDALLEGFTARMWRCRLLTFATVAAVVADRTVTLMGGREDLRLEARLAFERLFVSAIVQMAERDPENYAVAPRSLPGRNRARKALQEAEPLSTSNFLKGQAVNGPFGVIARLARQMGLVDDEGRMGRNAVGLVMAWAEDEGLPGLFDEESRVGRAGALWMMEVVKRTSAYIGHREWPHATHAVWKLLAQHLRTDKIGVKERGTLLQFLDEATVRRRVMGLLKDRVAIFQQATNKSDLRGQQERFVLLHGLKPSLRKDPTDHLIAAVIEAIDCYEKTTGVLQLTFEGMIWSLKSRGGRANPEIVISDHRLRPQLEKAVGSLTRLIPRIDRSMEQLRNQPSIDPLHLVNPMIRIRDDVVTASRSAVDLTACVLRRHERVQKEKRKAPWIERESLWTLLPGENRVSADAPPVRLDAYLHPFKIPNAYAMLADLRQVTVEVPDAEE